MKANKKFRDIISAVLVVIAVVLYFASVSPLTYDTGTSRNAKRVTRILDRNVKSLKAYMQQALSQEHSSWLELEKVPDYFTVYRYCQDTLQSWCNEFPIANDDIRARMIIPFVSNPRSSPVSPLSEIDESPTLINLGESWYLTMSISEGDCKIIGGVEVMGDALSGLRHEPHRRLRLSNQFSIMPLSFDGGAIVEVSGIPMFTIIRETAVEPDPISQNTLWLSLALIIAAALLFLSGDRSIKRLCIAAGVILAALLYVYILGKSISMQLNLFSPMLYYGEGVLYSLGAIVLINLAILLVSLCLYIIKDTVFEKAKSLYSAIIVTVLCVAASVGIILYACSAFRNIALNSSISLELFKISELSPFCVVVYVSFITALLSVPMLIRIVQPLAKKYFKLSFDIFSTASRIILSSIAAAAMIAISGTLGFRKEQMGMELLSGRLAFDRDFSLEMYLHGVENQIAEDMMISALCVFDNTEASIKNRISDFYFARYDRYYTFSVFVFKDSDETRASAKQYYDLVRNGVPISDSSRFMFVKDKRGHSYYVGTFFYFVENAGLSRLVLRIDTKDPRDDKGYAGIFGFSTSGRASVPPGYSFARYENSDLIRQRGDYIYPTKLSAKLMTDIYELGIMHASTGNYVHFVNLTSDGDAIVISRPKIAFINYIIAFILVALLGFLLLSLFTISRKKEKVFSNSYFRSRISVVLLVSLVLTLVVVTTVSVAFVYSKNDSNNNSVMIDRISSISSMFEANQSLYTTPQGIDWLTFRNIMSSISEDMRSDITLYSPDGKMIMSTNPIVFGGHILGERINGKAFKSIMHEHKRAIAIRESVGNINYFSMYSSILGSNGEEIAIVCSPYNLNTLNFEEDAITHATTIISLFIVFLLIARFAVTRIVDRMFRPLSEMSEKMSKSDIESLEYVDYDRNDEISSIVQAYNLMVREMIRSSKKIAQAERDKAWSQMARQVAHEIKNPLTPMKLQIQRVIRLKDKNDPNWIDRFNEASALLLDHIDILTETANEFSSFAKLYSEEPTDIDLAAALQSEISMFDNKSNISFEYIGLDNVTISGPKPQLTRVFVNLLNNSVQAIGDNPDGKILVSLRNSVKDGYYDIVFEDNGPGVAEENVSRLFTPNFTTKSGGSGLGLAISNSVLESCGASIQYSRSFALGGACFCIIYPKKV